MKDYFELEACVEAWAEEKGIFENGTRVAQAIKTLEESVELAEAVYTNNKDEIIDAMGDIMVTLIIQAKMQDVSLESCLNSAYTTISNRTGKMVAGKFVKD